MVHGTYLIEVATKKGVKDALASEIAGELKSFGAKASCKVATAKLYRLVGQLSPEERHRVGSDLLADPVVEEAYEGSWAPAKLNVKPSKNGSIVVDVWYKQGVTDAVGESVLKGIKDMHLDEITDVRTGMRYRFIGLKDAKVAEKIALAYLLNPLIHERFIHAD
jgi:phosphoribosylformylglycinamidine (FGAM) synthase PurS component